MQALSLASSLLEKSKLSGQKSRADAVLNSVIKSFDHCVPEQPPLTLQGNEQAGVVSGHVGKVCTFYFKVRTIIHNTVQHRLEEGENRAKKYR